MRGHIVTNAKILKSESITGSLFYLINSGNYLFRQIKYLHLVKIKTMEKGVFTQKLHGGQSTIVLDDSVEITREKFIEFAQRCKAAATWRILYLLDGSIKVRWKEHSSIVTMDYVTTV